MATAVQTVLWAAGIATCLKLLLVPAYRSTDFEVHRHWLAVTRSLPISEWYVDETSEWTLDYPPFFAWFERALAVVAARIDPKMVDLRGGLNYASPATILFQRATVMISDVVLYFATWHLCRKMEGGKRALVVGAVLFCPGLFIVDHIHFQYNGFLLGMLLLSLSLLQDGRDWLAGVVFAVLVCFKHLFAVAGPLYAVYLLRHFCWGPRWLPRLLLLGSSVLAVLLLAFGPFLYLGQMRQVLARLFPFGRGLCHAYWAPNLWALYNASDKLLGRGLRRSGLRGMPEAPTAALTGGLVGDSSPYAVLPQITPAVSAVLVLLSMLPCLVRVWRAPLRGEIVRWVAHVYMCGFMFGWHVHEKAALHFVVPLALLVGDTWQDADDYMFLSTVATYSLFPLLFDPKEYPIKVLLLVIYTMALSSGVSVFFKQSQQESEKIGSGNRATNDPGLKHAKSTSRVASSSDRSAGVQQNDKGSCGDLRRVGDDGGSPSGADGQVDCRKGEESLDLCSWIKVARRLYLWGIVGLEIYVQIVHPIVLKDRLPFLPLFLISVYSSIGMVYVWLSQVVQISRRTLEVKTKAD